MWCYIGTARGILPSTNHQQPARSTFRAGSTGNTKVLKVFRQAAWVGFRDCGFRDLGV